MRPSGQRKRLDNAHVSLFVVELELESCLCLLSFRFKLERHLSLWCAIIISVDIGDAICKVLDSHLSILASCGKVPTHSTQVDLGDLVVKHEFSKFVGGGCLLCKEQNAGRLPIEPVYALEHALLTILVTKVVLQNKQE